MGEQKNYQKVAANQKEPSITASVMGSVQYPTLSPDARFGPSASQVLNPVPLGWHEHTEVSPGNQGPVLPKGKVRGEGIQAQLHGQPGHCLEGNQEF